MVKDVYHGRQAEVEVGDPITVPELSEDGTDSDIRTIIGNDTGHTKTVYTGEVMDISITDPEASIELENTFGGQFMVETPADLVEIEVTMRFQDQEVFEEIHGTAKDVDGTWSRIEGTQGPGNFPEKSFLFELDDNGDKVRYLANKARFQSFGEVSLDAEGFAEITGVIVCLVEDRYIEQNF